MFGICAGQVMVKYMKKGTSVHRINADALEAYWKSQNEKIKLLEDYINQGGSLSNELKVLFEEFGNNGIRAYEKLMQAQNMLMSHFDSSADIPASSKPNSENLISDDINVNPWANPVIDAIDINSPDTIKRREVQITLCKDTERGSNALPDSGIILMLGDEDAYAKALKVYLTRHGLKVHHISNFLDENAAEAEIVSASGEGEITGIVVLGNKYYGADDRDSYYDYILTIACLIKRFVIYIRSRKSDIKYLFLFNTFLDGKLGMSGSSEYYHYGTLNGMAKCIEIELRGSVYVKEIDFEPTDTDTMIGYLDDELHYHGNVHEIGRTADGKRMGLSSVLTKSVVTENLCPLKEDDVLLVSGGSRGVTSACIIELAKRVKCRLVLLGRAQVLEENNDDPETSAVTELKDMKTLIAKRYKANGHKGSLTEIEKKARAILGQRELYGTMEQIRATGNEVYYYSCDVNDRIGMKSIIDRIQKEVGKITGVVHGAGIVSDSKIWNKDMKSFERVFGTKYKGLNNIMDHVDKESLKLLVMFSSLSGYFGNDGQFDYVAGNEYMDKYAYYIRNHYPNCRATAINWGAWNGGMMYVDALYIDALLSKGYILIPLEVGANYFVNDFLMGLPSAQILINNTGNPPV